jgi:hypothetical protein
MTMIKIKDIMTKDIMFYDPVIEDDLKKYCKNRDITFFPDFDFKNLYYLKENEFVKQKIEQNKKFDSDMDAFDEKLLSAFKEKNSVLFVFNGNSLEGVIHFSDYNNTAVFSYLYNLISELERDLRKLLGSKGWGNNYMVNFFCMHKNNEVYKRKYDIAKKYESKFNKVEPFQFFDLSDLIALCDSKKIIKLDNEVLKETRNTVMHSKNVVQNKDYESNPLIFNVTSFKHFLNSVIILRKASLKVRNRIKILKE